MTENKQHYLFGYFDEATQAKPCYDPGIDVPCLFCQKPLSLPVKTISLMKVDDSKSYFYRTHKNCYETASAEDILLYESSLINNL